MTKVINMGPLKNWKLLEAGKNLDMPGERRNVRLALVVAGRAPVVVTDMKLGQLTVIGYVEGMQEFLFGVEGDCQVSVDSEADVYYRTDDGDVTCVQFDNEPFVRMMERQPRNEELEMMMYIQSRNANKRAEQMELSMQAMAKQLEALNGRTENDSAAAGGNSGAKPPKSPADGDGAAVGAGAAAAGAGAAGAKEPTGGTGLDKEPAVS